MLSDTPDTMVIVPSSPSAEQFSAAQKNCLFVNSRADVGIPFDHVSQTRKGKRKFPSVGSKRLPKAPKRLLTGLYPEPFQTRSHSLEQTRQKKWTRDRCLALAKLSA